MIPETYLEKKRKEWIRENPDPYELLFENGEWETVRNLRTGMIIQYPKNLLLEVQDFVLCDSFAYAQLACDFTD